MIRASFWFIGDINILLAPNRRFAWSHLSFHPGQTVKHLVESLGVPHTEIALIEVNRSPRPFDYQVQDHDRVIIFPFTSLSFTQNEGFNTETRQIAEQLRAQRVDDPIEAEGPRFILDNHLGKLASHLRMLGFDCLYANDYQDEQLALLSIQEGRILLSRDHRLFMRKDITAGYWLRSQDPIQQLQELVSRYHLLPQASPFTRCMNCNHRLEPTSKEAVLDKLEPLTKKYFDDFSQCPHCGKVYWRGSHYQRMKEFIEMLSRNSSAQ